MNSKHQAVKRASLEFIESLESVNRGLLRQNVLLKAEVRKLKKKNYQLRDELMCYKFQQIHIGRTRSVSMLSMDLLPIKRDVLHGLHANHQCIQKWKEQKKYEVDQSKLWKNNQMDYDQLFCEYQKFKLYESNQSISNMKQIDSTLSELYEYLQYLKVQYLLHFIIFCCRVSLLICYA